MDLNINVLLKTYEDYVKETGKEPTCIALFISMPGGEIETIINPNVKAKIEYITKTYNTNLVHNNCDKIQIVGYGISSVAASIFDMLNSNIELGVSESEESDDPDTTVVISNKVAVNNGYLSLLK